MPCLPSAAAVFCAVARLAAGGTSTIQEAGPASVTDWTETPGLFFWTHWRARLDSASVKLPHSRHTVSTAAVRCAAGTGAGEGSTAADAGGGVGAARASGATAGGNDAAGAAGAEVSGVSAGVAGSDLTSVIAGSVGPAGG